MEATAHQELEQCKVEVKTGQTYREGDSRCCQAAG